MKLNLIINTPNYQLACEASSLTEFSELRNYLAAEGLIGGGGGQTKAPPAEEVKKDAAKGNDQKADATTAAASTTAEKATAAKGGKGNAKADAKAAATAKTAAGPTIEEVTAKLTAVADKFGVPEALLMNKRFGVKKAGELAPEQYATYIAFADHCVKDDVAPSGSHPEFDEAGEQAEEEEDVSNLV